MNKLKTALALFAAFTLGQQVTIAAHRRILAVVDAHNDAVFEEMQLKRFADGYAAAQADFAAGPPQPTPSSTPSTES